MTNYFTQAFISLTVTILLIVAAVLSPHEEGVIDIVLFGLGFISGAVSINLFKKHWERKRSRAY